MNKKVIIIVMCILIVLMAVGYAIFSEQLTITGTSHIDSRWDIRITNITTSDIVGDATEKAAPSYTNTTARLKVSLINPTDSITYNIKIKNNGTLSARVSNYTVTMGNSDAIVYEVKGLLKDQVLEPNEEQTIKIKISFKTGYIGDPSSANKTSTVKVVIDYVQNLDGEGASGEGETVTNAYTPYSIGDIVSFAGSNWYVIEDSSNKQDYVTLMKEKVLTNAELGSYAPSSTSNEVSYYYDDNCHKANTYGYTDTINAGCAGHSNYASSKLKEFLEEIYINTLGSSNLKEIDEYKIRVIKLEELRTTLGWKSGIATAEGNNVPEWVYKDYGGLWYWTMTPANSSDVITVAGNRFDRSIFSYTSVRPVINLYKSAIE